MNAKEFLHRLNSLPIESRASFSATVISLGSLAAAEAVQSMLKDSDFGVKINALKAIRTHKLHIYEKEIIALLIDPVDEVKVAAIRTLASFGNANHFRLIRAFFDEYAHLKALIIDSFVNFSDMFEAHKFMFMLLDSSNDKIKTSAVEWFQKALKQQVFVEWIATLYDEAPFTLREAFEKQFARDLKLLFDDKRHGYRFKLIYLKEVLYESAN